ncbi:CRE-HPR-9 protein [Caenorhabditis remanei]|uniref:CRE-HPR-9 protein n=1 Tax=Caenorhabditis remanei TaxID=31234 RepID=E3LZF3_CAERE|nr:CRE-HPR-9 protein [Caenorhabditis remanei]
MSSPVRKTGSLEGNKRIMHGFDDAAYRRVRKQQKYVGRKLFERSTLMLIDQMQATHETYADPSSSTSNFRKGIQHEDMKGAQFVVQSNLKIMSRSIAALSKISEDVLIEVSDSGLYFKIVNRSKFCVFRFAPEFFNACDVSLINNNSVNICRLSMKSAQKIFKGVAFGEKNFVGCEFRIDPTAERMMVKLQMNYDIDRTIHANLREMGSILHKPTYDRSTCRNTTVVFASTLLPILAQMKSDIEVTMNVTKDGLTIRNFHSMDGISMFNMSDQKGGKKVKTETTITADKLTRHKIQIPVEFSFSFKEFMAIVIFADQLGSEVCLYYDLPGRPFILSIEAHPNFDIELALATMGNDDEIDLDGGIIKETLIHHEVLKSTQSSGSHKNSKRNSPLDEINISSSSSRSKRGPVPNIQDNHSQSPSQPSKNKFMSGQEKPTPPAADMSWRDHEIIDVVEQREPSPDDDVQPVEERNTPGEVLTDIMEIEEPAQMLGDNFSMRQEMSDFSQMNMSNPRDAAQNELKKQTKIEREKERGSTIYLASDEYNERNEMFKIPEPKRRKVDDNRNTTV